MGGQWGWRGVGVGAWLELVQATLPAKNIAMKTGGLPMGERVYKQIEVTGTSTVSLEDAIQTAVARAARTLRHLRWFEVVEIRGAIQEAAVAQWQVTVKIGFAIEDAGEEVAL